MGMSMTALGVFHEKFKNNDMRAQCFFRELTFFDKIWIKSSVILDNGRFFTKYWQETSYLLVKIRKKRHPIDFLGPYYSVVLTELTFFDKIWSLHWGVFHENFENMN